MKETKMPKTTQKKTPKKISKKETEIAPDQVVGKSIAKLTFVDQLGHERSFSEFKGKKVVLFFYPKDNTPGCTIEGNEFNALIEKFKKKNTVLLGVSRDSAKSHCKFIEKFSFEFDLISDEDEQLCSVFNVIKEKNMYGKKVMGIERSTFVIDEKGYVVKAFRKVSPPGHAEEILGHIS